QGAVGLGLALRRLQTTASVLHIGAHPDDEDSALIAKLARTDGARVAYLSLNRGEGGQNRIGSELFDALGVIRTEELLQARKFYVSANPNAATRASNTNATQSDPNVASDANAKVVRIETGDYDPLLGRSAYELAMEGRSQHKSQGETALELKGEQASGARL